MADKYDRALGKPFKVFISGMYSGGLGLLFKYCSELSFFDAANIAGFAKGSIAFFALSFGSILYYFLVRSKFDDLFINLGIGYNDCYPIKKYTKYTENSIIYGFRIPAGVKLQDFEDAKQAIENFIGHKVDIRYTYKAIEIEEFLGAERTMYPFELHNSNGKVVIVIGYLRNGKLVTCDLSSGEPHMLIAGETGSGKSTTLRAIIVNLLLTSNVILHLVDLKNGTEFRMFEKCKNVVSFARNVTSAITTLNILSKEVDKRYDLFYQYDVKDIEEYNHKFKNKLDYQVLIMDEFADLQSSKEAKELIDDLGRKARACGIHMILATQRPDSKVLDGNIKANVTNILGLKTLNAVNSNIILGEKGLEELRGKGHGIFKRGGKKEIIQAPFLDATKARELVKPLYIEKRKGEESKKDNENIDLGFLEKL